MKEQLVVLEKYPYYEVSNLGYILKVTDFNGESLDEPEEIKVTFKNGSGYVRLKNSDGKVTSVSMAIIIATTFVDNNMSELGYNTLSYIDGNRKNFSANNLEWSADGNEIINLETGEVYGSIKGAANALGVTRTKILNTVTGNVKERKIPVDYLDTKLRVNTLMGVEVKTKFSSKLEQFAYWIEHKKSSWQRRGIASKLLRNVTSEEIAFVAISMIHNDAGLSSTCRGIGRVIVNMNNYFAFTSEKEKVETEYKIGYDILNILFDTEKISLTDSRNTWRNGKRESMRIVIQDDHWMPKIKKEALELEEKPVTVYANVSYERPQMYLSNDHPVMGKMVRRANALARDLINMTYCSRAFDAINDHMSIGYKVNREVLNVIEQCLDDEVLNYSNLNIKQKNRESKLRERDEIITRMKAIGDKTYYCYMFYDYRGRMYFATSYVNYGGSKLSRGLTLIDAMIKREIGSEGLFWMLVHASNTWGHDKEKIDRRYDLAIESLDEWLACAKNPIDNKLWQKADSPFEFLAAILELKKAYELDDPTKLISGLPIGFDASCSGLQCLAALSKDEKSARLCNLIADSERGDYYTEIADYVWTDATYSEKELKRFNEHTEKITTLDGDERAEYIKTHTDELKSLSRVFWGRPEVHELRRLASKRPCMTFFYGGTIYGMADSLYDDLSPDPRFYGITKLYCNWLARKIYHACKEIMKGPAQLMDLFIKMGLEAAAEGKQILVHGTYNNFPFVGKCTEFKKTSVSSRFRGRLIESTLEFDTFEGVRKQKVASGSAPNVTHMFDSQILSSVILNTDYEVVAVHDCFSTTPDNAGDLYETVRESFVEVFKGNALEDFLDANGFGHLMQGVTLGTLDVEGVIDNEHCFS